MLSVVGRVMSAADAAWCVGRGVDAVTIGTGAVLHHDFAARPRPVSRDVLRAEFVGLPLMDHLAEDWDDLVA